MSGTTALTIDTLNAADAQTFAALLDGIYERSPWVAGRAASLRPFVSLAHLKGSLVEVVRTAAADEQLALLRAHPELGAQTPAIAASLTPASATEQRQAGLTRGDDVHLSRLHDLTGAYRAAFGWPFILAVRGPRGLGLPLDEIVATLERRLDGPPDAERTECLRQVHRIAELRLNDRFAVAPALGHEVWDRAHALAAHSESPYAALGQLTVTYLSDAHRASAATLSRWMREDCGFDRVSVDAVGNVVGVYEAAAPDARRLLTGSHYDTVPNGGRFDGRLGILVPMICVRELHHAGRRLPFGIEVVAFAEEEGQRYGTAFIGSSALAGRFDARWLERRDPNGVTLREALEHAGLAAADIPALRRDPGAYLGFVEVHIEQGPVLHELDLPLGVVTGISGCVRYRCEIVGTASHAGTTPMRSRRDALVAAAELALFVERRAAAPGLVGTIGALAVPDGADNVVPGRVRFTLDLRATADAARDRLADDVLGELGGICRRRGLRQRAEETLRAGAAASAPDWQRRWERAVAALGIPVQRLPSGAGHDAMVLGTIMPQAMLFVRGQNGGISHNPLESITSDDAELAVRALAGLLEDLALEMT